MLLLLYLPAICGLAIVSRISFDDAAKLRNDKKDVDAFLIGTSRRSTNSTDIQRVTRRKPEPKMRKNKISSATTERRVPIIRGAASSKELVAVYDTEDLHPPRVGASDTWFLSQSLESSTRYPDSNGYYPNVGPYSPPTTPRPVYGVPPSTGTPSNWCPSGQGGQNSGGGSWGQQVPNNNGPWGQGNGGYRPGQGGYPPSNSGGTWGQGGQNPSMPGGNWGQGGQGGYPPSGSGGTWGQGQGGYPPGNSGGWGQSGQGGYPQGNSGGTWGQSGQGQGGYRPSSSGGGWGQNEGYPSSGAWRKPTPQRQGNWIPCQPYDLSGNTNRPPGNVGCPTGSERDVFVPPLAPPTNKVHDKVASVELPDEVEEIEL